MAVEANVINSIRRRVVDYADGVALDQLYNDAYYQDAISQALSRLNRDIGQEYTLATLPSQYDWAVILLGTITMCGIRSLENYTPTTSGGSALSKAGDIRRVEHKNQVVEHYEKAKVSWDDLCEDLWDQYKAFIDSLDDTAQGIDDSLLPVVTSHFVNKENPRLCYTFNSSTDQGIKVDGLVLNGTTIASGLYLNWDKIVTTQFSSYKVFRHTITQHYETERTLLTTIRNITITSYIDKSFLSLASPQTYIYTLVVTNGNGLESKYQQLEITI